MLFQPQIQSSSYISVCSANQDGNTKMGIIKHFCGGVAHACLSVLESSATAVFQNLFRIALSQLHHPWAPALSILDNHKHRDSFHRLWVLEVQQ